MQPHVAQRSVAARNRSDENPPYRTQRTTFNDETARLIGLPA
jgi:hypothetical protein